MRRLTPGPPLGLDIGTSGVRAAQVTASRNGLALTRFAQVAMPRGALSGGEVKDQGAVGEAIGRLWKRLRPGSREVVIGVANQRVVVRQVDLPFMEEKDLKSSLPYLVADHIPMPIEEAELDHQVVAEVQSPSGERMLRVLLVAAARDMVRGFVGAVREAGLRPKGVDLTPFAAARAVSPVARGEEGLPGAEVIIDVGAGVTNLVVHVSGEARFVRMLLFGGDDLTRGIGEDLGVGFDEAEAIKLDLGRGVGTPEAKASLERHVDVLVKELQGSVDYYLAQEDSEALYSAVCVGGGSLTVGLAEALEQALGVKLRRGGVLSQLDVSRSKLTPEQVEQADSIAAAAVGLAMGVHGR